MVSARGVLGDAARAGDWQQCRAASRQALAALPPWTAIDYVRGELREALEVFEQVHPGEKWPHRALTREIDETPPEYAGPGANSLVKGIEKLWIALRSFETDGQVVATVDALVDALAESVMSRVLAGWGALHPESWADWYNAAASPGHKSPHTMLLQDDDGLALVRAAWLHVATTMPE